jgi:poly-gamma-glutamate synthesis protein (capsule biosynthesis protein)
MRNFGKNIKTLKRELLEKKEDVLIHFVGDIMLARDVGKKIKQHGPKVIISGVQNITYKSDILCGNLESPISKKEIKLGGFKAPVESIEIIKNFDLVNLANNHIYDCGDNGIEDTLNILNKNNIKYVGIENKKSGAYDPVILAIKENIIAFFGCTTGKLFDDIYKFKYSVAVIEDTKLYASIKKIRNKVDFIVLLFHGGNEFIPYPPPSIRNELKKLILAGTDFIIGHHPHVLSGYEIIEEDKLIWYSLGDFIFDSEVLSRKKSIILELEISSRNRLVSINPIPIWINDNFQPQKAFGPLALDIVKNIEKHSKNFKKNNYEKIYIFLYIFYFIRFQLERIHIVYRKHGIKYLFNFVKTRFKYLNHYICKFTKGNYK